MCGVVPMITQGLPACKTRAQRSGLSRPDTSLGFLIYLLFQILALLEIASEMSASGLQLVTDETTVGTATQNQQEAPVVLVSRSRGYFWRQPVIKRPGAGSHCSSLRGRGNWTRMSGTLPVPAGAAGRSVKGDSDFLRGSDPMSTVRAGAGQVDQPGVWLRRSGSGSRAGSVRGPGASHLCGPCLRGCSEPAGADPRCKASPLPSSRRAAEACVPTWCWKRGAWEKNPGCSQRPRAPAIASPGPGC